MLLQRPWLGPEKEIEQRRAELAQKKEDLLMKLGKSQREKSTKQVVSVAAFRDGQLLFGLRGDVNKWCMPGGHLEPNEQPARGAVRELLEETGLKAKNLERLGSAVAGKSGNVLVHSYQAEVEGTPDASKDPDAEFVEFRWVDPMDIPDEIFANLYNPKDVTLQLLGAQEKSLELSKTSLSELMARTKALSDHIRQLANQGVEGHIFPHRMGGHVAVTRDPSKPGRWRATRVDATGTPIGHIEAPDMHGAIKHAHSYGADVMAVPAQKPIVKAEGFTGELKSWLKTTGLAKSAGNLFDDDTEPATGVALDMLGFNPIVHPAFAAAKFLSGRPEVDLGAIRRALYETEDYIDAALFAYGLPMTPEGRQAIKAVMNIGDFTKSSVPEQLPKAQDIEPGTPDAEISADAIRRAFKLQQVKVAHLDGKHSKGALIARDSVRDRTYLLKPGSGGAGVAAGATQEHASQSRREAAFWQIAEDLGLGESVPRCDLLIIDGKEYAAIEMLPFSWKGLQKRLEIDPAAGRQAFALYRDRGIIHKWAVMDYILGNPDRHGDNLMISADGRLLGLIDHGSAFAGPGFDPAYDRNSFVPFYLRAWAPMDSDRFNSLTTEKKLARMPTVNAQLRDELRSWLNDIHADHLEALMHRFGIDPRPSLARLARLKVAASSAPVDEAVNRLWVTT